jgi:5-methylcytosine-specific restriction endonuclease McrA
MSRRRAPSTGARRPRTMIERLPISRRTNARSQRMATIAEIVGYWRTRQDECGLSVDWADAHKRCWGCGRKKGRKNFDRCHIVPRSQGGANGPDNLVLLCTRCHREAPNVNDPPFMWLWLRSRSVSLYDTAWIIRGLEEFERIFKRKPFDGMELASIFPVFRRSLEKFRRKAIIHFGEGRLNPATVAWVISQIESDISQQPVQDSSAI